MRWRRNKRKLCWVLKPVGIFDLRDDTDLALIDCAHMTLGRVYKKRMLCFMFDLMFYMWIGVMIVIHARKGDCVGLDKSL